MSGERTLLSLTSCFPRLSCPARKSCLQRWTDFKWHSPSGAGRVDLRADVGPDLTPGRIRAREAISVPWSWSPSAIVPMNSYPRQKPGKLELSLSEFWVCIFEGLHKALCLSLPIDLYLQFCAFYLKCRRGLLLGRAGIYINSYEFVRIDHLRPAWVLVNKGDSPTFYNSLVFLKHSCYSVARVYLCLCVCFFFLMPSSHFSNIFFCLPQWY